jgi:hypothetical protein
VPYTICSRGLPIGTTDLAFAHLDGAHRMGWFHPNAEGERLMPVVAAMHRALHASTQFVGRPEGAPTTVPHRIVGDGGDDLERALTDVEALQLTLLTDDGSPVPTMGITIADTQTLRELHGAEAIPEDLENLEDELVPWGPWEIHEIEDLEADGLEADELDEDLRRMLELDDGEWPSDGTGFDAPIAWEPAEDPARRRWQVHVSLADESAIP